MSSEKKPGQDEEKGSEKHPGRAARQTTEPRTGKTTAEQRVSGVEMLRTVLGQLVEQLVLWDLEVRRDAPGAVHQMRVTSRWMRSLLKAAAPLLDGGTAQELDVRLRELARALSGARDAEVTAELLPSRVHALGGQVDPMAAQVLQRPAEQQPKAAAATARGHLSNPRHLRLLADVQAFAADPPLTEQCRQLSAGKVVDKLLRRALHKVVRVGAHGVAAEDSGVVAGWLDRTASSRVTGEDRYALGLLHGAELAAVHTGIEHGHDIVADLLVRLRMDLS